MYPQTCTQKAHAVRPTSIILQNCSLCSSHCAATPTFLERQLPLLPHIDFQGTPRPPSNVSPNKVLERSIREHCRQCLHIWSAGVNPKDAKKILQRFVPFFLRTQKMLTTEFWNDWYDVFVCEPKNMLFSEFCNDCSLSFCEPNC